MSTDIVLTVDADTLLECDAIAAMRQAFAADPCLVAATGVLVPSCGPSASGRFFEWFQTYEYIRNFLSRYAWSRLDSLLLISGAFAGFRRTALLEVGGFDPDCLVEDYELIHRLLRFSALRDLGWHSAVLGRARAGTDAPGTPGAFLRQRRRWFGGFLQTQFWYRDMVGNPRYGWLGLAMLPVKAADTLQPIYGLTAFFLLIFFLLTGRFAVVLPAAGVMLAKNRHRPCLPPLLGGAVPPLDRRQAQQRTRPRLRRGPGRAVQLPAFPPSRRRPRLVRLSHRPA